MRMHLVIAAAFAGLCSHAALADPEADFWQQPEPKTLHTFVVLAHCGTDRKVEQVKLDNPSVYQTPAEVDSPDRVLRPGPGAKSVDADHNETIRLIVQGEGGCRLTN
jgi:hypothetical protein